MSDRPEPAGRRERIAQLDVLRGLAVLGILMVNAPAFAMPPMVGDRPDLSPWPFEGLSVAIWWMVRTVFEQKFVTLFSLLFGVSVFLVGGERGAERARGAVLRRRISWLIVFGVAHGALIWFGDILLLYGLAGLAMMFCRSWGPWRLATIGLGLMALSCVLILQGDFALQSASAAEQALRLPDAVDVSRAIARLEGGLSSAQALNLDYWLFYADWSARHYGFMTLGLMMVGLALFKLGVWQGRAPRRTYLAMIAAGAAALAVIGWNAADQVRDGFPSATLGYDNLPNLALAPVVTLGYVAAIILGLRNGRLRVAAALLTPVGRMAFTNYIAQSLIMTAIFYGGRGLGLVGRLDWPQWTLIVVVVWLLQIGGSGWWLKHFTMGPLEWVWRQLSYGRQLPLVRHAALERPAVPTH